MTRCDVVLAEDDDDLRAALVLALERHGLSVVGAGDEAVVVSMVRAYHPSVLILDLTMGCHVARRLRADPATRTLPIVVASGARDLERQAARLGAAAVLPKPFGLRDLYATIRPFCRPLAAGSVRPV